MNTSIINQIAIWGNLLVAGITVGQWVFTDPSEIQSLSYSICIYSSVIMSILWRIYDKLEQKLWALPPLPTGKKLLMT